ncbi:MAG: DUF1028 domain-containing protein [Anaerolineae bacterium]|nr:MAG: DUF1028 domain-containing protein [Anaerolineae bacterium]
MKTSILTIHPSTFSIVAHDPVNGDLGVAVQSKFLAVGSVVPFARAGSGAVATQSYANVAYGPEGLRLMAAGWTAQEALNHLLTLDLDVTQRQVLLVDAAGGAAGHTGEKCHDWAGHLVGDGYACGGNILLGEATVQAMAETFEGTQGALSERLVAALAAGQAAGGDSRGQQSAALLVVRTAGSYGGRSDRYVDLRVDDHPEPIAELERILGLHRLYLTKSAPEELIPVDENIARELQVMLQGVGHYQGEITGLYDEATKKGLWDLYGIENLEERWHEELIDVIALEFLRQRFG